MMTLQYQDFEKDLLYLNDDLYITIGAILSCSDKLITYASRTLNTSKINYSTKRRCFQIFVTQLSINGCKDLDGIWHTNRPCPKNIHDTFNQGMCVINPVCVCIYKLIIHVHKPPDRNDRL